MDKKLRTFLPLLLIAGCFAILGAYFGDEIEASVPGGKATGLVAGVVVLLVAIVKAYNSIKQDSFNKLDREGFDRLLEIYFGYVTNDLTYMLHNEIDSFEKGKGSLSKKTLLLDVQQHINKSRAKLAPFFTSEISSIPEFLDNNFPTEQLEPLVDEFYEAISSEQDVELKKKYVFKTIQHIQADLIGRLRNQKTA